MIIKYTKRSKPDYSSYLWGAGIFAAGCFIAVFLAWGTNSKPSYRQTQVAEAIISLVKQPSSTGQGLGTAP